MCNRVMSYAGGEARKCIVAYLRRHRDKRIRAQRMRRNVTCHGIKRHVRHYVTQGKYLTH